MNAMKDAIKKRRMKSMDLSDLVHDEEMEMKNNKADLAPKGSHLDDSKPKEDLMTGDEEGGIPTSEQMKHMDKEALHAMIDSIAKGHGDFRPNHGDGMPMDHKPLGDAEMHSMDSEIADHIMNTGGHASDDMPDQVMHKSLGGRAKVALLSRMKNKHMHHAK